MTRAHSCGGQVAPEQGPAAERRSAQCNAIWQKKAGQKYHTSSKGQCLLLCKMCAGSVLPFDAGALAGAQLWPPHSLNAGA